ncbi:MAG: recombinase family protein [Planctomycetaceae bacterium]|nr:recombinase family protein [Planctomycetaceae bacterium]
MKSHDIPQRIRAAQYVRMSTEQQQNSTSIQQDVIREYAQARGYEIVRTYADDVVSGRHVADLPSLRQMIADVQSGNCGFSALLVCGVTRLGRCERAGDGACAEGLCKQVGIEVHTSEAQFENDEALQYRGVLPPFGSRPAGQLDSGAAGAIPPRN